MATKKRAKAPAQTPDDAVRAEDDLDVESAHDADMNTDVERADSSAPLSSESVEALVPTTDRTDIEHGVDGAEGDVERGDAGETSDVERRPD